MEDENIDLFGNRVKIAGGANNALLRFSRNLAACLFWYLVEITGLT